MDRSRSRSQESPHRRERDEENKKKKRRRNRSKSQDKKKRKRSRSMKEGRCPEVPIMATASKARPLNPPRRPLDLAAMVAEARWQARADAPGRPPPRPGGNGHELLLGIPQRPPYSSHLLPVPPPRPVCPNWQRHVASGGEYVLNEKYPIATWQCSPSWQWW